MLLSPCKAASLQITVSKSSEHSPSPTPPVHPKTEEGRGHPANATVATQNRKKREPPINNHVLRSDKVECVEAGSCHPPSPRASFRKGAFRGFCWGLVRTFLGAFVAALRGFRGFFYRVSGLQGLKVSDLSTCRFFLSRRRISKSASKLGGRCFL